MHLRLQVAVITPHLVGRCRSEADVHFPLETGGVLMGYQVEDNVVVTGIIGPGPNAVHQPRSFEPDYEWQNARIARHYAQSGRRETYIGDWHSHPRALSGDLSREDRAVVRKIIRTPAARMAAPLMAIFYGSPKDWQLAVWSGRLCRSWLGIPRLIINSLTVRDA